MKKTALLPWVGLLLLAGVFGFSAWRVLWRAPRATGGDAAIMLRFAHVTIHSGVIRAYDDAIKDYEKAHPDVRIEQVPVPLRLWASWLRTQMIGGTGPDIADMDRGQSDEFLSRFFLPLDAWTERPNPHNTGTDLANVPWRDTFVDGLVNPPAYRESMQRVYGIPLTTGTSRVFVNAELLVRITGEETPPRDYDEFMALCEKTRAHAEKTGRTLVPIAGSQTHALPLLARFFSSQTHRLTFEINPYRSLLFSRRDAALAYLDGRWSWKSPEVMSGLELMAEVAAQTVQGFSQLSRDDSLFYFTQGRALMLATGSFEADTIISQSPFKMLVFEVPLPGKDHPRFGREVIGPVSELGVPPGNAVGVSRTSRHAEQAVDFLRFLTSRAVSERVMGASNRLSSVIGVKAPPGLEVFTPIEKGWPAGFPPELIGVGAGGAGECVRVYRGNLHALVGPTGSAETFARVMDEAFPRAVADDLRAAARASLGDSRSDDAVLASLWLGSYADEARTVDRLGEVQTLRELETAQIDLMLRRP